MTFKIIIKINLWLEFNAAGLELDLKTQRDTRVGHWLFESLSPYQMPAGLNKNLNPEVTSDPV